MKKRLFYKLNNLDRPFKIIEGNKKDKFKIGTLTFKLEKDHKHYNRLRNLIINEKKIKRLCWSRKDL